MGISLLAIYSYNNKSSKAVWCAELQDLAEESLSLLRGAIGDARFPALFDLDVYGSIVGMFELNNLGKHTASEALMSVFCIICNAD